MTCIYERSVEVQWIQKLQKHFLHTFYERFSLNSLQHVLSQFSSWCETKMLANIEL